MLTASGSFARNRDAQRRENPLPDARRACARRRIDEPSFRQFSRRKDRRRACPDGRARRQLSHGVRRQRSRNRGEECAGILRRADAGRDINSGQRAEDDAG